MSEELNSNLERRSIAISVVIPTYNRLSQLQAVLRSLELQDVPSDFEVVVISDGSNDGTAEFIARPTTALDLVGLTQENRGPAAARNAGIERARGEIVLFLDDDVVAHRSLLRMHHDLHLELGPNAVVIGPMSNPDDHEYLPWVAWEQAMIEKQYWAMKLGYWGATAKQFYTGNASVQRKHLVAVGGFDESLRRAEDIELGFRLADIGLEFHFAARCNRVSLRRAFVRIMAGIGLSLWSQRHRLRPRPRPGMGVRRDHRPPPSASTHA